MKNSIISEPIDPGPIPFPLPVQRKIAIRLTDYTIYISSSLSCPIIITFQVFYNNF